MIWGFYDMQLKCPSFVCICMRICRNSMLFFACSDPHPVPILSMTQNIRNREDTVLQQHFCGISTAALGAVCLAGDRKAACFSGYGAAHMDRLRVIEATNGW